MKVSCAIDISPCWQVATLLGQQTANLNTAVGTKNNNQQTHQDPFSVVRGTGFTGDRLNLGTGVGKGTEPIAFGIAFVHSGRELSGGTKH